MKPLIGKRIGATKSFRCKLNRAQLASQNLPVYSRFNQHCKRTLQPVRRLAMGPVACITQVVLVTKHLCTRVSSSAVRFGAFVLLGFGM